MVTFPAPRTPALRGGPALRWGVLGPGQIANDFTATLHANTDQRVVAVGSRSAERAAAFASRHGVGRAHGSTEALVSDPDVDIVYVATPHSEHLAGALAAIGAGKHVLVEKPITTNAADARTIRDAARAAGVFAAEAMWTRYLPQSDVVRHLLDDGAIGRVRLAAVELGWASDPTAHTRMTDPARGGGALLDIGVYSFWFAQFAIGVPSGIRASGVRGPTGVDTQSVAALAGPVDPASGSPSAHATVATSMLTNTPGDAAIHGTAGSIVFTGHFVFPASFRVVQGATSTEWQEPSGLVGRDGLAFQATAIAAWIAEGRSESPVHSLDDSVALMTTLDAVAAQVG